MQYQPASKYKVDILNVRQISKFSEWFIYIAEEVALRNLGEIPSGPGGLVTLSTFNWLVTSCSVIITS